jgi:serine/threonine protein kinase
MGQPPGETASCRRNTALLASDNAHGSSTLDVNFLLPSSNPDALGRIGDCDVLGLLGRGGMGVVFQAFDTVLQRVVAIKTLSPQLASSSEATRRFLREARAAAGINHPNVVVIHAVGEQSGMPYLVMEYVAGRTLHDRIHFGPVFDLSMIQNVAWQVADGLAAAHRRGIIHRDIKPRNIMLEDGSGRVRIADFGLALVVGDALQLTSHDRTVGTPAYMSPEQVQGVRVDHRSDLFSLGCVLHAMVTGSSPFQGSHVVEIARKVADSAVLPLHKQDPRVPASFAAIVQRLLEKDPARRYQSAEELQADLIRQLPSKSYPGATPAFPLRVTHPRRKRVWPRVAATLAAATLLLLAAWAAVHYGRRFWSGRHPAATMPGVLRVAKSGESDYHTLGDALAHAEPGTTIRVVDDEVYRESLQVRGIDRRGVTLEAEGRATLVVPVGRAAAVQIEDAQDVTIRGFQIRMGADQHGIVVTGLNEGVSIEDVAFTQPTRSQWAALHITDTVGGPIGVKNCAFQCGLMGIVVEGPSGQPVSRLLVENNRFMKGSTHLFLNRAVEDVSIRGNIFVGGIGVGVNLAAGAGSQGVRILNNTFLGTLPWMTLEGADLPPRSMVCNNLVLGAERIHTGSHAAEEILKAWTFRNNWWEPGPGTDATLAARFARVESPISLLSRENGAADFLRPPPHSPLGSAGAGGDLPSHVGALPPADPP